MIEISTIQDIRSTVEQWRKQGLTVGLVPTMGYLHEGHKSLIRKAKAQNDKVVVSIFVNPIQFGPNEDFEKYPRDREHDRIQCADAGTDVIFAPTVEEMYPTENRVYIDTLTLGDSLCGAQRPGHFRGVCTVVAKLFNITAPNRAYFGEKDAQQLAIIKRMVKDLNFSVEIVHCPIIREHDGLAMSSRNSYLSQEERKAALVLSKSLGLARGKLGEGQRNATIIRSLIRDTISAEPLARIDYVEVADAVFLQSVESITAPVLIAIAVYIGKTRLIDNLYFEVAN